MGSKKKKEKDLEVTSAKGAEEAKIKDTKKTEDKNNKGTEEQKKEAVKDEKKADSELLALKDAQIEKLNDQIRRNMAEFDNYRKRTEKEKSLMFELGATGIVKKLLPIIDNFERALEASSSCKDDSFRKGIELIYKQFLNTLDELDVKEIKALHEPFNPDLHHAVAHELSDEYDENIVIQVMQKGYTYKDKVIRYSMVSVAN